MSVGLIAALPVEARYAVGRPVAPGTHIMPDGNLIVHVSGMGPERALQASGELVDKDVDGLVSWGTAAALSEDLKAGDLVLPDEVHAETGNIYSTDSRWRDSIRDRVDGCVPACHVGRLAETSVILASVDQKTGLHRHTGALCADMETAAVLSVARSAGLPAIAIRAIIDEQQVVMPAALTRHLDAYGEPELRRLVLSLFLQPGTILPLMRLARAMRRAGKTLETVRRSIGTDLLFNGREDTLS